MRQNGSMEHQQGDPSEHRYGFGLTTTEVERLRRILARCGKREVSLEEAWGRAAELLSLTHELMEALASEARDAAESSSSKVVPGALLTDART